MKKELEKFIKEHNFDVNIEVTDESTVKKLLKMNREVFERSRRKENRISRRSHELAKTIYVG